MFGWMALVYFELFTNPHITTSYRSTPGSYAMGSNTPRRGPRAGPGRGVTSQADMDEARFKGNRTIRR
jgi:hypothetical protein